MGFPGIDRSVTFAPVIPGPGNDGNDGGLPRSGPAPAAAPEKLTADAAFGIKNPFHWQTLCLPQGDTCFRNRGKPCCPGLQCPAIGNSPARCEEMDFPGIDRHVTF